MQNKWNDITSGEANTQEQICAKLLVSGMVYAMHLNLIWLNKYVM